MTFTEREEGNANPTVSVVIPFLNAERFLHEAVESVLAQTFADWDLILVDDGSSDGSSAVARAYAARNPRIRVLEHPNHENRGTAASRNLVLANGNGEFIAPLDSDDVWEPRKLEEQVAILREHPSAALVYGSPVYWRSWNDGSEEGDYIPELKVETDRLHDKPPELALRTYPLGKGSAPSPSDLLLRRATVEELGGWDDSFKGVYAMYEDQVLLVKIYLASDVYVSSRTWTRYRLHEGQVCARVTPSQYWDMRLRFLDWLEHYIDACDVRDPRLRRAVRRAATEARHPALRRVRQLKNAVLRRIASR